MSHDLTPSQALRLDYAEPAGFGRWALRKRVPGYHPGQVIESARLDALLRVLHPLSPTTQAGKLEEFRELSARLE